MSTVIPVAEITRPELLALVAEAKGMLAAEAIMPALSPDVKTLLEGFSIIGLTEHLHGYSKLIWIQISLTNCRSNGETRKLQYQSIYEYILKMENDDRVLWVFKKRY